MPKPTESTVVAGGNHPAQRLTPRHTRARSGCERCRAQRRKCDEGKPRCKRCASADALCKYVTHVSFRDKNSQSLSEELVPDLIGASTSLKKYHTIEFIFDDVSGQTSTHDYELVSDHSKTHDNEGCSTDVSRSSSGLGWPLVGRSPLSSTEIDLLKYYSHRVAPWLNIYDQDQKFGHDVARLAINSPCVLEVLLQLSAVSSGRPIDIVTRRDAGIFHIRAMSNPPGTESPSSALRMIACFVLARTVLFVDRIPDTWERSFQGDGAFSYFRKFHFHDTAERQMWFSFLTLILRLETAYYLMNQMSPVWIPDLARHIQAQSGTTNASDNKSHRIFDTFQCLGLLLDAISVSFLEPRAGVSDNAATPSQSRATTSTTYRTNNWKNIISQLRAWHKSRPSGLKPLIEIDDPEGIFPVVIFSSVAGVASNTVYHAAMLLLLSNTIDLESVRGQRTKPEIDESLMSPLWHALRICGIAINSDCEYSGCWDPVMIAAFSLAAREMKQSSQRSEITAYLDRLKASGWRIDGLISKIHSEWRPVS
ncbi:hypothetical protein F5Y10DRAFT_276580 [Nemania abortiva]|nr:hypothetical protein F5Y10DRAFT_276580 [Nemania abortiva]